MCGLVAFEEHILKLEQSWADLIGETNKQLIAKDRKPIRRYHASELNARDGEFEGWTPDESKEFSKNS